ncbi:MAG: Arm DNA-binding domain-containing protein [Synergistaceae bacterium]|nr:Arm DNA-binding domain-containing protein [Synergistaceae bacterium]
MLVEEGYAVALTEMEVRKAKGREKPYQLGDGNGLHLEVLPWKFSRLAASISTCGIGYKVGNTKQASACIPKLG